MDAPLFPAVLGVGGGSVVVGPSPPQATDPFQVLDLILGRHFQQLGLGRAVGATQPGCGLGQHLGRGQTNTAFGHRRGSVGEAVEVTGHPHQVERRPATTTRTVGHQPLPRHIPEEPFEVGPLQPAKQDRSLAAVTLRFVQQLQRSVQIRRHHPTIQTSTITRQGHASNRTDGV